MNEGLEGLEGREECSVAVWNSEGGQGIRHWSGIALGLMAAGEQGRSSDGGQLIPANPANPAKQAPQASAYGGMSRDAVGRRAAQGSRAATAPLSPASGGRDALLAYELPYTGSVHAWGGRQHCRKQECT